MDMTERQQQWIDRTGGKVQVTLAEAQQLLVTTARNSATGLIGGPYSPTGYTLNGSLRILAEAERIERGRYRHQDALCAHYPKTGCHVWYLNLDERIKADPWA